MAASGGMLRSVMIPCPVRSTHLNPVPMCFGTEMTAKVFRNWLEPIGAKNLYIEPGSPWENGYCERFNGKPPDEL